jgi:hypothetical protein
MPLWLKGGALSSDSGVAGRLRADRRALR